MSEKTIFQLNADALAQLSGVGTASYNPTYANPMTISPNRSQHASITTTSGVGNATVNADSVGAYGQSLVVQINNDSSGARTITFGTNFRSTGTVVGTASKTIIVHFVSDGTAFFERSRSAAAC